MSDSTWSAPSPKEDGMCEICLEARPIKSWFIPEQNEHYTNTPCDHMFCQTCMQAYVKHSIESNQFKIPCPSSCNYQMTYSEISSLAPSGLYDSWVRLREDGFLEKFLRTDARDLCDVIGFKSVIRNAVVRKRALMREEERRRKNDAGRSDGTEAGSGQADDRGEARKFAKGSYVYAPYMNTSRTAIFLGHVASLTQPGDPLGGTARIEYDDGDVWDDCPVSCLLWPSSVGRRLNIDGNLLKDFDDPKDKNTEFLIQQALPSPYYGYEGWNENGGTNQVGEVDWRDDSNPGAQNRVPLKAEEMVVGLEVEAGWTSGTTLYTGKIASISHKDKTCTIHYDDGDVWNKAPFAVVFRKGVNSSVKMCPQCCVMIEKNGGCDSVTCVCGGRMEWKILGRINRKAVEKCVELWENGDLEKVTGVELVIEEEQEEEEEEEEKKPQAVERGASETAGKSGDELGDDETETDSYTTDNEECDKVEEGLKQEGKGWVIFSGIRFFRSILNA